MDKSNFPYYTVFKLKNKECVGLSTSEMIKMAKNDSVFLVEKEILISVENGEDKISEKVKL